MKKKNEGNAIHWVSFRVTEAEYRAIRSHWKRTCHRALSEYARNSVLQKPVTVKYRNESADKLLQEIIEIKKHLSAFGNNYNQAVKRLHGLMHDADIKRWLADQEHWQQQFRQTVNQLLQKLNQIHEQWSSG